MISDTFQVRRSGFPGMQLELSNKLRGYLPDRSLKNIGEVGELLEETINRVRQGPFDLRAVKFTQDGFVFEQAATSRYRVRGGNMRRTGLRLASNGVTNSKSRLCA